MIRRNPLSAGTNHSEPLHQASFTAMKGIDSSKAVTVPNVVQTMENLNVNTDGSVSVRKPLILKRNYTINVNGSLISATEVAKLYDNVHTIAIYTTDTATYLAIYDEAGATSKISLFGEVLKTLQEFSIDLSNSEGVYDISNLISVKSLKLVNTNSSSVLGAFVNLTNLKCVAQLYNKDLLDATYATAAPRYLYISKRTDSEFKIVIKTPEINTLDTGSSLVLNPNLTLDSPYATRDVYNSNYVSVDGILPYTYHTSNESPGYVHVADTPASEGTGDYIHNYSPNALAWTNAVPPGNPMRFEFGARKYSGNFSKSMSGVMRIRFNKTHVSSTSVNEDDVCSLKPYAVTVKYTPYYAVATNFNDSNPNVVHHYLSTGTYSVNGSLMVNAGTPVTRSYKHDQILGDSVSGFYIDVINMPVAAHMFGPVGDSLFADSDFKIRYTDGTYYSDAYGASAGKFTAYYTDLNGNDIGVVNFTFGKWDNTIRVIAYNDNSNLSGYDSTSGGLYAMLVETTVEYRLDPAEDSARLVFTDKKNFNLIDMCNRTKVYPGNENCKGSLTPVIHTVYGYNYPFLMYNSRDVYDNILKDNLRTEVSVANLNPASSVKSDTLFKGKAVQLRIDTSVTESVTITPTISRVEVAVGYSTYTYIMCDSIFKNTCVVNITQKASVDPLPAPVDLKYSVLLKQGTSILAEATDVDYKNAVNIYTYTFKPLTNDTVSISLHSTLYVSKTVYAALHTYTVEEVTERQFFPKFTVMSALKKSLPGTVVLKAFMHFIPHTVLDYYGIWEYTLDGVTWQSWYTNTLADKVVKLADGTDGVTPLKTIHISDYIMNDSGDLEKIPDSPTRDIVGCLIRAESPADYIYKTYSYNATKNILVEGVVEGDDAEEYSTHQLPQRADCMILLEASDKESTLYNICAGVKIENAMFRFTVCSLDAEDNVKALYAQQVYVPNIADDWEPEETDLGTPILGDKLYYNKQIFSYNDSSFKNNVLCSDYNSFITPYLNTIDVNTLSDSVVTALVPWRNYLVASTEDSVHLITLAEGGATLRTVCTYIGISQQDRKTCKALLNGIVFKSGPKFYTLYPNASSGDESILNLNEISHPINHILERLPDTYYDVFSISTERKYYTFIPYEDYTYSVIYDYNLRVWYANKYEGVRLTDYSMDGLNDITVYGIHNGVLTEYYFERDLKDVHPNFVNDWDLESFESVPHGDFLTRESITPPAEGGFPNPNPIHFILDSGQRTDNISLTRKFVESKFLLATLNAKAAAAKDLTVSVYVDGNPYKTRLKGDGIVFKDMPNDIITLGDDNPSDDSDVYNSISQAFLRYSGKGKTIRHVIEGDSLYNFKLYEVFYRYRPMPNKQ